MMAGPAVQTLSRRRTTHLRLVSISHWPQVPHGLVDISSWSTARSTILVLYQAQVYGRKTSLVDMGPEEPANNMGAEYQAQVVPIPAAFWLLGSGLVGLVGGPKAFLEVNIGSREKGKSEAALPLRIAFNPGNWIN